jgi:hypothetical protein
MQYVDLQKVLGIRICFSCGSNIWMPYFSTRRASSITPENNLSCVLNPCCSSLKGYTPWSIMILLIHILHHCFALSELHHCILNGFPLNSWYYMIWCWFNIIRKLLHPSQINDTSLRRTPLMRWIMTESAWEGWSATISIYSIVVSIMKSYWVHSWSMLRSDNFAISHDLAN